MKCPRCGYTDESTLKPPLWACVLRTIAKAKQRNEPIFGGLLDGRWRQDRELVEWTEKGWIEIVKGRGFVTTAQGDAVVRQYGLKV